jgi:uncharacterized protein YdeI (YjbR/CyaY-like superfamily)
VVEVRLNGIDIGMRNPVRWKERGWNFGLAEPMCRKVGVETGSPVRVEMRRVEDPRPAELVELMEKSAKARADWEARSAPQRREFSLFVAGAKQAETRARRAGQLLGGG